MIMHMGAIFKDLQRRVRLHKIENDTVEEFRQWLRHEANMSLLSRYEESDWRKYIYGIFKKGIERVYQDSSNTRRDGIGVRNVPYRSAVGGVGEQEDQTLFPSTSYPNGTISSYATGFIEGRKEQFIRSTLAQEETVRTLQLLQTKITEEMKGMVDDLVNKCVRGFIEVKVKGSPDQIRQRLMSILRMSLQRTSTIIHTETTRAHAEAQLCAMDQLGIIDTTVQDEWVSSTESCKQCSTYAGKRYDIKTARGMIPFHPNCYCCWKV